MNQAGKEYLKRIANLKVEKKFKWTDSAFQERLMRFGQEMKMFDVHIDETDEIEMLVIASLKEDIARRREQSDR